MTEEHSNMHPKTYPEMNTEIVGLLRMSDPTHDPMSFYVAKRIEELEEQNAALKVAVCRVRDLLQTGAKWWFTQDNEVSRHILRLAAELTEALGEVNEHADRCFWVDEAGACRRSRHLDGRE